MPLCCTSVYDHSGLPKKGKMKKISMSLAARNECDLLETKQLSGGTRLISHLLELLSDETSYCRCLLLNNAERVTISFCQRPGTMFLKEVK